MNVQLLKLQSHGDKRGCLIALEQENNIPFEIKRIYYMFNTVKAVRRGFHAHKTLKQVAIAVRGSCKFHLDDGSDKTEILLDKPSVGLLIDSFVWREMYDFSEDCVLMVLADQTFNEDDYIRDYDCFIKELKL